MKRAMGGHRQALAIGVLVLALAGCQQSGGLVSGGAARWGMLPGQLAGTRTKNAEQGELQLAVARQLETQGKLPEALQAYRSVAETFRLPAAYHRLAVVHDKTGDFEAAARTYEQALQLDPSNAELLCDVGYSYMLQQRWQEGEAFLRRAVTVAPQLARAHNNLGMLLARTGRIDEALAQFTKGGGSEAQARTNLAFALVNQQRPDEARRQLQLALAQDPSLSAAQQLLSLLARQPGEPPAQPAVAEAAKAQPAPAEIRPVSVAAAPALSSAAPPSRAAQPAHATPPAPGLTPVSEPASKGSALPAGSLVRAAAPRPLEPALSRSILAQSLPSPPPSLRPASPQPVASQPAGKTAASAGEPAVRVARHPLRATSAEGPQLQPAEHATTPEADLAPKRLVEAGVVRYVSPNGPLAAAESPADDQATRQPGGAVHPLRSLLRLERVNPLRRN